ncbi:MAG: HPr-rel-A system PqqD family peptide chaperone [Rhodobacterales bacterium]|nr:HPr-rel-A system PqqD family peptide chaperone [Rhodobacterales bacterium]
MPQRWIAISAADLYWRSWNDETVVYNDLTGDTHQLDPLTETALRAFTEGALDAPGLATAMTAFLGEDPGADLRTWCGQTIDRLAFFGLIEPAADGP